MRKTGIALLLLLVLVSLPAGRSALAATTHTYAMNEKNDLVCTQDAYLPDKVLMDMGLSAPEDLFIDEADRMYIADTGNHRIVIYDIAANEWIGEIAIPAMKSPKGVFTTEDGSIYVADSAAQAVFLFSGDGQLIQTFTKPRQTVFADVAFSPVKVAADKHGNIFLVGEGVYSGIIQLSAAGEFLGYFTVNKTRLTLEQAFKFLFYTKEQKDASTARVPSTFSSVYIDDSSRVYTTTMGMEVGGVKKHNTAGLSMFSKGTTNTRALSDITTDKDGIIYVSDTTGLISVYADDGEMIFRFGGAMEENDIVGQFKYLSAIALDSRRCIWALDKEKNMVQSLRPTEYGQMVYSGLRLFNEGRYDEALEIWNEVFKHNQMSVLAHNCAGKCYLYMQDYERAMEHFYIASDREYYSEAFWEVRNIYLQKNLTLYLSLLVGLVALIKVVQWLDKKRRLRRFASRCWQTVLETPILGDVCYFLRVPRHPLDRFYDLRVNHKGTVLGASVLYAIMLGVFLLYETSKGFLFQTVSVVEMDLSAILIGFIAIPGLFILCNWLVSSVRDGDGSLAQIYIVPAYSLLPLMVALAVNIAFSYALTYNEAFFYHLALVGGGTWSLVLLVIGLQEIHQYSFGQTVKSMLLTIGMMLVVFVLLLIVIVMFNEFTQFLMAIFKEAISYV